MESHKVFFFFVAHMQNFLWFSVGQIVSLGNIGPSYECRIYPNYDGPMGFSGMIFFPGEKNPFVPPGGCLVATPPSGTWRDQGADFDHLWEIGRFLCQHIVKKNTTWSTIYTTGNTKPTAVVRSGSRLGDSIASTEQLWQCLGSWSNFLRKWFHEAWCWTWTPGKRRFACLKAASFN